MQVESRFNSRSIASEVISKYPKYDKRAADIDRSKIEIDKDLDLLCFSEKGEAFREKLLAERKDYKIDLVEKEAVSAQNSQIEILVAELVALEVNMAALKEKKAFKPEGEEIANQTISELKTTLESLLQDEIENDLAVLKSEIKKEKEAAKVVKDVKPKTKEEDDICDLVDKNKALTKQVEELLAQQAKITENMLSMNNMMFQMNQRSQMAQQQQYIIPSWLMQGSMVNPQLQYPYLPYYPQNTMPQVQPDSSFLTSQADPQLGQKNYQQNYQSGQYQYLRPQTPNDWYNIPQIQIPGNFGSDPFSYNFAATPAFN